MQNCPRGKLTSPRLMLCSRPRLVHQQDEAHVARRLWPFLLLSNASVRKGVSHRHLSERLAARRLALPLSELSGDADGLADSCVCKFSISAFLVSRSCWRLLISACWGGTVRSGIRSDVQLCKHAPCAHCRKQCLTGHIYLPSPVSTARAQNNCVGSQQISGEGFVLKFTEFERHNRWQ